MKPRLLALTLLAGLVLAGLWLLRTGGRDAEGARGAGAGPAASAPAEELPSPPPEAARGREEVVASSTAESDAPAPGVEPASGITTGSIVGRIVAADGQPLEKVWARGQGELGTDHEASYEGGEYRIDALPPGRVWVAAGAPGYRAAYASAEARAGEETELDFTLERSVRLALRILTPEGEPHPDVVARSKVHLLPVVSSRPLSTGWFPGIEGIEPPRSEGRFEFSTEGGEQGWYGTLLLDGPLPVHVALCQSQWVLACELVPEGSESVTFHLAAEGPASGLSGLRVRVRDAATRAPVSGGSGGETSLRSGSWILRRPIDEEGRAEYSGLAPGRYWIRGLCPGRSSESTFLRLAPGETADVELLLDAGLALTGRLVDPSGHPPVRQEKTFGGAIVLGAVDPATDEVSFDRGLCWWIDEQGSFSIPVRPGLWALRVEGEEWASTVARVDARAGVPDPVEIAVFQPAVVSLELASGSWLGTRFRILDESGLAAVASRFQTPMPLVLRLAPGTYRLLVTDPAGLTLFETAFVAAREPLVVPVRL